MPLNAQDPPLDAAQEPPPIGHRLEIIGANPCTWSFTLQRGILFVAKRRLPHPFREPLALLLEGITQ
jgi:hypothetical protein